MAFSGCKRLNRFHLSLTKDMYDRWDNEETARKEAGERFHFYWQKFHWMRTHTKYFFVMITATTIAFSSDERLVVQFYLLRRARINLSLERNSDLLRAQDTRKLQAVGRF